MHARCIKVAHGQSCTLGLRGGNFEGRQDVETAAAASLMNYREDPNSSVGGLWELG